MSAYALLFNTMQCNAIQFYLIKHGKNLQFTDGKYDKLNKYKNTINWFTRRIAVWRSGKLLYIDSYYL